MPFDALPQLESQRLLVGAPRPAFREFGADDVQAVLRDVLVIDDQVVENGHEGDVDRIGRALMDRRAAGAVAVIDPEDTALLRLARDRCAAQQQQARHRGSKRAPASHVSPCTVRPLLNSCAGVARSTPAACCALAPCGHRPHSHRAAKRDHKFSPSNVDCHETSRRGGVVSMQRGRYHALAKVGEQCFCAAEILSRQCLGWVTSVALCNRRRPIDFRYAPFATEDAWRCNMSRRANRRHQSITSSARFLIGR